MYENALNVLLIQDDRCDAKAVRAALAGYRETAFCVEWVRTLSDGVERLRRWARRVHRCDDVAAVLIDLRLIDLSDVADLDLLFMLPMCPPVLVLSTIGTEPDAKRAVQRGADDYYLKNPMNAYLLPKALQSMLIRTRAADALFESQQTTLFTLNSIGDAVMCIDGRQRVTFLNKAAERLTGWSNADALGLSQRQILQVVDADSHVAVANPLARALESDAPFKLPRNCNLVRNNGAEVAIEDSATPLHDRRGRVTGAVIVLRDVSVARAASKKLAFLADHDGLTELPNRLILQERLDQAIACAHRQATRLAVLVLDVDRFKHVNDSLGYGVGDRLLHALARRLTECAAAADTVGRQGGDEFVIVLASVGTASDAALRAAELVAATRRPFMNEGIEVNVTASVGVAVFPEHGSTAATLLQAADASMYEAKKRGRNCFQMYRSGFNSGASERQILESDLHHALKRAELALLYQPKVNLVTNRLSGVEALIRWKHPQRGLVGPNKFIVIAEKTGLIVPIGQWVLREACLRAAEWRRIGLRPGIVAVNVSTVELRVRGYVDSVKEILAETRVDPTCLEFEITETFLLEDSSGTAVVLRSLKELGIHLALDDFGTGYSSLSYMRRFPIDTLKVDHSFVRDLATDVEDACVVQAIIHMGKTMGMGVVAEGVETLEQLAFLRRNDCPEGQGFYFSHPLEAGACADLLAVSNDGIMRVVPAVQ